MNNNNLCAVKNVCRQLCIVKLLNLLYLSGEMKGKGLVFYESKGLKFLI